MIKYIILFLLVFDIAIPGLSFIPSSFIALIISCLFILITPQSKNNIKNVFFCFKEVIFLYLIILLFVCFRVMFSSEISFLLSTFKSSLILISSIVYIYAFYDDKMLFRLFNIFFFNALVCLFFGTFQQYNFILAPFQYGGELIGFNAYRNSFLAGSGYFGIAIPYIFVSCFYFNFLLENKKLTIINSLKILTILIVSILAGRISIPIFVIYFIYLIGKTKKISIFIFGVIFIAVFSFILQLESLQSANEWILEMFSSDNSISESSSITSLRNMYSVPQDDWTFFIGDGQFQLEDGGYYMHTDVGFLRHWYFGGVLFMILPLFIMPLFYIKNKNTFYITLLFPIVVLFHFKGLSLLNNPTLMPVIYLVSYSLFTERKVFKSNL